MTRLVSGQVVHRRLRPAEHVLRYRVFALMLDPEETGTGLRLFSRNRFNLVSVHDRDHGNGLNLLDHLREAVRPLEGSDEIVRFRMLCYPRVLGYVFNPLTVYFGLDEVGRVRAALYEVTNTFGQRKTYALPVTETGETIALSCPKTLYVSPFNNVSGTYSFRLTQPDATDLTVGVALRTEEGPLLNAYFTGTQTELTDRALLWALARTGLLTLKVIVGIHWEALKLWAKGLRLQPRPLNSGDAVDYGIGVEERP